MKNLVFQYDLTMIVGATPIHGSPKSTHMHTKLSIDRIKSYKSLPVRLDVLFKLNVK